MDIGVPLKDLGTVDVSLLVERVATLTEADWQRNTFRQDVLAYGAHSVTESILFKQEWHLSAAKTAIGHMEDMIWAWATNKGLDPVAFLPVLREDTDLWPVYTFPDWLAFKDVLEPVVDGCIRRLGKPRGIVTRLALVRLPAGGRIRPHVDGHAMAARAHRLHVALSSSPSVTYKIDGRKFTMQAGHVYDFNNLARHSVRNEGRTARINLFVDFYPNPGPVIHNPLNELPPMMAPPTPRAI